MNRRGRGRLPWQIVPATRLRFGYRRGHRSTLISTPEAEQETFAFPEFGPRGGDLRFTMPRIQSLPNDGSGMGRREDVPQNERLAFPYASICRITSRSVRGTGFLTQDGRIITAAHVIHGAVARTIAFPGKESFVVPGERMRVHPDYHMEGDLHDIGVIKVDPGSIGVSPIDIKTPTAALLALLSCEVAGYPIDFADMVRYPKHGGHMPDTRKEVALIDGFVKHRLDTSPGQSGAPILARRVDGTGAWFAIGVHCYGEGNLQPGWLNRGVPMPGI